MLTIEENMFGVYENSLYYLYNVFVNLKLFQNKMFTWNQWKSMSNLLIHANFKLWPMCLDQFLAFIVNSQQMMDITIMSKCAIY